MIFILIVFILCLTTSVYIFYTLKFNKLERFSNNDYKKGLVSVIIPTYNRYKNLLHAIKSVQKQTYKNIEIIVVNDCSTNNEYYNGYIEEMDKVKLINLPVNQRKKYNAKAAQGKTREEGIKISIGEWIAFLDDDDYWLPDKIEKQLNILNDNKNILFCSTNMLTGNGLYDSTKKYNIYQKNMPNILKKEHIKLTNHINNSTVILHKKIINKVGEFILEKNEDWDYWKRSLEHTDCYYLKEPLVYYDIGHGNGKNYIYT